MIKETIRDQYYDNILLELGEMSRLQGRLSEHHATVSSLSVDQSFNRQGIGTKLFNHFKKKVIESGVAIITIEVFKDNERALQFWMKHGFCNPEETDRDHISLELTLL
ncbi:GNAT family N-acetyltransferase [Psychromonas sp. SP041]|uniref:GNAT family N-acetyltransferase n=1 Tax=Psychromonas sp. SP041 TaxID=1365007 RepID=UPI0010C7D4E1|nr:GNAT family N-acetyltransferase [Psychromonas sp. SP041]